MPTHNDVSGSMPRVVSYSRLFRAENMQIQHKIPLGTIVEIDVDMDNGWGPYRIVRYGDREIIIGIIGKIRMFVVKHARDCDGTPLYCVASAPVGPPSEFVEHLKYRGLVRFCMDGIDEESMKVVGVPPVEVRSWEQYKEDLRP